MDNIFGVGLPELIVIVIIAGMVLGPERIVRAARTLGEFTGRLQRISRSFIRQLQVEVNAVDQDGQLQNAVEELNQLRRQVAELKSEFIGLTSSPITETKQTFREIKNEAENSILPPGLGSAAIPAESGEKVVHRPPSLFPVTSTTTTGQAPANGQTAGSMPGPMPLPQRLDIAEDPD